MDQHRPPSGRREGREGWRLIRNRLPEYWNSRSFPSQNYSSKTHTHFFLGESESAEDFWIQKCLSTRIKCTGKLNQEPLCLGGGECGHRTGRASCCRF